VRRLTDWGDKIKHFYIITLDANECIDATLRGNMARYINHSCNPNAQVLAFCLLSMDLHCSGPFYTQTQT
jgi:hypothetical protein